MPLTYILTVWYCVATQPTCDATQDPTGPPVTREFDTRTECEAYFKWGNDHIPTPDHLRTRHTCEPKGDDI